MTPPAWQRQFEELRRFKRKFGHCRVPRRWPENPGLARWVSIQRNLGGQTFEQVEALHSLGFDFGRRNEWLDNFFSLVLFQDRYGPPRRSRRRNADRENYRLCNWVEHQRQARDRLGIEQKRLLNAIDFDWAPYDSLWQRRYDELKEFKCRHGHCDVPLGWADNRPLARWVASQRVMAQRGELAPDRRRRLDAIEFGWPPYGTTWDHRWKELTAYIQNHGVEGLAHLRSRNPALYEWLCRTRQNAAQLAPGQRQMLAEVGVRMGRSRTPTFADLLERLREFKRKHGHCDVTRRDDPVLAEWLGGQRRGFRRRLMSPLRQRILEGVGIVLDPVELWWEEQFEALRRFRQEHGHCVVGIHNAPNKQLLGWVQFQKMIWSRGRLREDRRKRLEALGFVWNTKDAAWDRRLRQLEAFCRRHGHCNVWLRNASDEGLLKWVLLQRTLRQKGKLTEDRQRRLEQLGFVWDGEEASWDDRISELVAYRRKFGSFNIPGRMRDYNGLRQWVYKQRCRSSEGKLDPRLKAKLDAIGFSLARQRVPTFGDWIERLRKFKQEHGHCKVTARDDASLARWLTGQRVRFRDNFMPRSQQHVLEGMGVVLDLSGSAWEEQFQALRRFHRRHGHCDVRISNAPSQRLLMWVQTQKLAKKKGWLREDRRRRMEELDFVWNTREAAWERGFRQLEEFRRRHGHCDVRLENAGDPRFLDWISLQRLSLRQGRLKEERRRRLERVGFVWSADEADWDRRVAELLAIRKKFGSFQIPVGLPKYDALRQWTYKQRSRLRGGTLAPKLKAKLDAIGFR